VGDASTRFGPAAAQEGSQEASEAAEAEAGAGVPNSELGVQWCERL
jgi:hypothetical protein